MNEFEDYQKLVADWASSSIHIDPKKSNTANPITIKNKDLFDKIFSGFTEISDTYDALILSGILISKAPPTETVEPEKYIKYIVSAYLQEIYILRERLDAYAKKIQQTYKNNDTSAVLPIDTDTLRSTVQESLEPIIGPRNDHVHINRYSDDEFAHISMMALASKFDSSLKPYSDDCISEAKVTWAERIKSNNIETKKLLDWYFGVLILAVKDGDTVRMP